MNQKQKKQNCLNMIKELTEVQMEATSLKNKNVSRNLKNLLEKILKETIDFEHVIYYINNEMKHSKSIDSKILWIKAVGIVRKYFDTIE